MWQETRRIFVESAADVLRATARILPSVFAMLLFFALAAVLAFFVRWAVRRACERLRLDQRLREWGVAAPSASGRAPPSLLLARLSFWAMLLGGAFLGLSVIDTPAATTLSMQLVEYVPRALLALLILGIGIAAGRIVERSVLIGAVNMGMQSARLLSHVARWFVVSLAAAIALEHAGVGAGVVMVAFGILFGGIVLAMALAVGLGAKPLVTRSLQRRYPEGATTGAPPAAPGEREPQRMHHL